jgi:hypothetical protein
VVGARGASTPFEMNLPLGPTKVEFDPDRWVLSDKVTVRSR